MKILLLIIALLIFGYEARPFKYSAFDPGNRAKINDTIAPQGKRPFYIM